jgi:hypothetical protein
LGAVIAKLFGEEPELQLKDDLGRMKQILETGEIATTEGQPRGGPQAARIRFEHRRHTQPEVQGRRVAAAS